MGYLQNFGYLQAVARNKNFVQVVLICQYSKHIAFILHLISYASKIGFDRQSIGLQDDARLDLHNRQVVHPGIHSLTKSEDKYHPYYHADDSVQIKFAKIDETTYNIQKAYSEMVALSSNPIFSSDVSMPTNINGGLGFLVWLCSN